MVGRGEAPGPQAYPTMRNNLGPPMTLANMRQNGVRAVTATCEACRREADVNVDALSGTVHVPEAGQRLRCSQCGGKTISTRPAWHTARDAWGAR
jgi:ABC-type hemin transport system substrate-binding protein